jgi:hypothetical protein
MMSNDLPPWYIVTLAGLHLVIFAYLMLHDWIVLSSP